MITELEEIFDRVFGALGGRISKNATEGHQGLHPVKQDKETWVQSSWLLMFGYI